MAIDVFVSVGRTSTPEQEKFVASIEQYLRDNDLNPRTVGRSDFSSKQPLQFIEELMQQCSGTVIIAFERIYIEEGIERRTSDNESEILKETMPTVWNQIEATMAYTYKQPLLVMVEKGLRKEGLLETGYDWYVQLVDIDAKILHGREFAGVFNDWKKRVEKYQKSGAIDAKKINPEKLTMGQILGSLKPAQLWTIIVTLVGAISAIAATAYKVGAILSGVP